MKNATRFLGIIALGLIMIAADSVSASEGVSPGATDRMAEVNNACPTFSWGMDRDAVAYDVVAYVLPEDASQSAELTVDSEVLFTRVAGSATSWTPSAEQCFEPGGRYLWFVRGVNELAGDEVVAASEWSEGRYFTVPAAPSAEEMQRALDVLRRWDAANGDGSLPLSSAAVSVTAAATAPVSGSGSGSDHRKSVPTASAAIRGEHPDISGEKYGVVGTSASNYGAGVAAANLNSGPDLVLDGSADSEPDARLYEWGLERESATDWHFQFNNPGVGALNLDVDGTVAASGFDCPNCVTSAEIANLSVTGADLADDSVSGAKIADGAVGGTHLATGAVSSVKILDGTILPTDVSFNYAGSASKGGPATNLVCSTCVTASELSPTGGSAGQVLKHNGPTVGWADDQGLALPYTGALTASDSAFFVENLGTGWAIHAKGWNNNAITGEAEGNGSGVFGRNNSTTNAGYGVGGITNSESGVGVFGAGGLGADGATGVKGTSVSGSGVVGESVSGAGVRGDSVTGEGVHGEVPYGKGVVGISGGTSGVRHGAGVYGEIVGGTSGDGVYGVSVSGNGVVGVSTAANGHGVYGENGLNWGALGRSDAGVRTHGNGSVAGAYLKSELGYGVHAVSAGSGLTGAALYADADGSAGIAVRANNDSTDATIVGGNSGTGDLIKLFATNNLRFRVTNDGEVSADGAFTPGGADFAELLPARDEFLEPGDVLAISADGRLMKSRMAYQASVVGVYSTKPGVLGGTPADGNREGLVPLAVVGVVPVKVCTENGPVRPGDMLVASSVPGHAMRAGDRAPNGRVIGKALTGLDRGEGVITILVILL